MHFDAYGAFLIVVFNIIFWLLALYRRSRNDLANSYFWWSFFITLWAFGYGITLGGFFDYEPTLIWNKYCQAMALMVAPFFFHLGCMVARQYETYKKIFWFYFMIAAANAVPLFFTNYYVRGLWSFADYRYQPLGGPLYWLFTLIFLWCTFHVFWIVAKNYRNSQGLHRKQMALFLLATGLSYAGGLTLFLQAYRIQFPSTGVYLILSYNFIIGYSVIRYKFLDIDELVEIVRRERLAAIGLLSASINHEIRSPLFVIKGHAETLLEGLEKGAYKSLPEEECQKRIELALKKTIEQASRVVEITKRLTDFSKPQAGGSVMEPVNLNEVVDNVLSFVGHGLKVDNIEVEKTLSPELTFQGDRKEMEQIFLNLIINASQAMEKQTGQIRIEAHGREGVNGEWKKVEIRISDTGPGIPSDRLSKIFEPFFTTKQSGTGLGLYITKQLVERNKGKISVESKPNEGTHFILKFPANNSQ